MVHKLCAICGRYFSGDLNGDYRCRDCEQLGETPIRPLSSLDSLDSLDTVTVNDTRNDTRNLSGLSARRSLGRSGPMPEPPAKRRAAA